MPLAPIEIPPFISEFFDAYVQAALWSSYDDKEMPMDKKYSEKDLAPEHAAKMLADCQKFYAENNLLELPSHEQTRAGHDFWLTRNGHGSGFWDGDWSEPQATLLTLSAHTFGNDDLYIGDDGLIYGTTAK